MKIVVSKVELHHAHDGWGYVMWQGTYFLAYTRPWRGMMIALAICPDAATPEHNGENVMLFFSACRRHHNGGVQNWGGVPHTPLEWRSRDLLRVSLCLHSCIDNANEFFCPEPCIRTEASGANGDLGYVLEWQFSPGYMSLHVRWLEDCQLMYAVPGAHAMEYCHFRVVQFGFDCSFALRMPYPQVVCFGSIGAFNLDACDPARNPLDISACRRPVRCEKDASERGDGCNAAAAQDDGGERDWFLCLEQWGSGCIHSVLAILLASLFRLLLMACKLKGGRCNIDPWIYQSRRVLRPAPICFWILLAATRMQEGLAVQGTSSDLGWTSDVWADVQRMDMNIQLEMSAMQHTNVVQSAEFLEFPLAAQFPQEWMVEQAPDLQQDVRVAVVAVPTL